MAKPANKRQSAGTRGAAARLVFGLAVAAVVGGGLWYYLDTRDPVAVFSDPPAAETAATDDAAPEDGAIAADAEQTAEVTQSAVADVLDGETVEIGDPAAETVAPDEAADPRTATVASDTPDSGTAEADAGAATADIATPADDPGDAAADEPGTEVAAAAAVPAAEPAPSGEPASPAAQPDGVAQDTAPELPRFDIVRIDATGSGLVAGRASPGATVRVMAGTTEIARAEASASGEFVAFIQTPATDEGQSLSLIALTGQEIVEGAESLLVLPVAQGEDEAPLAPAVISATGEDVRVIQPSGLGAVNGVTLDTISYDAAGEVVLAGRTPGPQPIRIYLNGAAAGVTESTAGGSWQTRLDGIKEGRYVLRVDALRPDGTVESRAESPFQRVFPTAAQRANPTEITVQPGNTLWVMARDRYGSGFLYTQIFAANRNAIRDPDLIYPGQIFTLPEEEEFE